MTSCHLKHLSKPHPPPPVTMDARASTQQCEAATWPTAPSHGQAAGLCLSGGPASLTAGALRAQPP